MTWTLLLYAKAEEQVGTVWWWRRLGGEGGEGVCWNYQGKLGPPTLTELRSCVKVEVDVLGSRP